MPKDACSATQGGLCGPALPRTGTGGQLLARGQGLGDRAHNSKWQVPSEARGPTEVQAKPSDPGAWGGQDATQTQTPDAPKTNPDT